MALRSFKDLLVWQKAQSLTLNIYTEFSECKDYGFKDQIQRAAVSISNNIAEGYGRRSDNALMNFLNIARGSAAEVESMLLIAHKLGYIDLRSQGTLLEQTNEVAKLITAFRNKLVQDGSSAPVR
jgi:four helix bundle protein